MKKIQLCGRLAKKFGETIELDIESPAEGIRALTYRFPEFEKEIRRGQYLVFRLDENGNKTNLAENVLALGLGKSVGFVIEPVRKGAKFDIFKVIVGALLIGAAFFFTGGALGATAFTLLGTSVTGGQLALVGGLLALSGISAMLAPQVKTPSNEVSKSFTFDAPGNRTTQGGPVPCVYGFGVFVGSVQASVGVFVEDYQPEDTDDEDIDESSLSSNATIKIIDILSNGEIEGLTNGDRSVFLNKIPFRDLSGKRNHSGVKYKIRNGTANQSTFKGLPAVYGEVGVGSKITNSIPVSFVITDADADAAIVKIRVPSMTKFTKKGSIQDQVVELRFDVKTASGSFVETGSTFKIKGHTTAAYERSRRLELPAGGAPWTIRVRRVTADNSEADVSNDTFLSSYTVTYDEKITYADTAVVYTEWDAARFGNQIAARIYEIDGIKCKIPSNYNPRTRNYSGSWDGTFTTAATNNPVWVLYDQMTDRKYGLGRRIPASQIDKWALYTIAEYCDGLVDDSRGGFEPRFTFNGSIKDFQSAVKLLDAIAACFRSMIYWSSGLVSLTQDSPGTPKKLVSAANVIRGEFNTVGSSLKARHTVVNVQYADKSNFYEPAYAVVQRDDLIAKFGHRPLSIAAFGCDSPGQAQRVGEWILDTEDHETDVTTWQASLDHADVRPGHIVNVADPSYAGKRMGGRIRTVITNRETAPNDLTNAAWVKTNTAIVGNATTDWRGLTTADKINETAVNAQHIVHQVQTLVQGTRATVYRILKAAERSVVAVSLSNFTTSAVGAWFNLTLGTITLQPSANADWGSPTASITPLGDGWFLCAVSAISLHASDRDAYGQITLTNGGLTTYLGVAGSGVYCAWSQWERGSAINTPINGVAVLIDYPVEQVTGDTFSAVLPDGSIQTKSITAFDDDNTNRNLLAAPFNFNSAEWGKLNIASVNINSTVAPDGTVTADLIIPNGVNGAHYLEDSQIIFQSDQTVTFSVYLANGGYKYAYLIVYDNGSVANNFVARFNLDTGEVDQIAANGTAVNLSARVEFDSGFVRCIVTGKAASVAAGRLFSARIVVANNSGAINYPGDGVFGIYAWGAKLEAGAAATPVFQGSRLLSLSSEFTTEPQDDAMFIVNNDQINPRPMRVVSNIEKADNIFEITAVFNDNTKYARIERNRFVEPNSYSIYSTGKLRAPRELDLIEYFQDTGSGAEPFAIIAWRAPADESRVTAYEYQTMNSSKTAYSKPVITTDLTADLGPTPEGTFQFRVRSRSLFTTPSLWAEFTGYLLGANQPVPDVTTFNISVNDGSALLTWSIDTSPAIDHFEIRYSPLLVGATWNNSTSIGVFGNSSRQASIVARNGTYLIKAVSYGDRLSKNPKLLVYSSADLEALNVVALIDESAEWQGLGTQKNIRSDGVVDIGRLLDSPFWTNENVTITDSLLIGPVATHGDVTETAVFGKHGVKHTFDLLGKQKIGFGVKIDNVSGIRQTEIVFSDDLGNVLTYRVDSVTNTIAATSNIGNFIVESAFLYTPGVYAELYVVFNTVNYSSKLTLDVHMHNGTSAEYMGVVTNTNRIFAIYLNSENQTLVKYNGELRLGSDGGPYMSSWSTLAGTSPMAGTGNYILTAYYFYSNTYAFGAFDPSVDFGYISTAKIYSNIDFYVPGSTFYMSSWSALNELTTLNENAVGVSVKPQARFASTYNTGIEDANWGDWVDLTDEIYEFRYAQFRLIVKTDNPLITPFIRTAQITVDMEDRVLAGNDIACPAGGMTISYDIPFMAVPALAIDGQGMNTGDYSRVTAKSTGGFTVQFFNSAGTGVARTYDWIAKGYGKKLS